MVGDQQFSKHLRLLNNASFKRVFSRSQRSSDAYFTVRASFSEQPRSRLGLAISKRHARLAVQRNRIKRCVREVFRLQHATLRPADYVVVNHAAAANASRHTLQRSIEAHFRQLSAKKSRPQRRDSA